MKIKQEKLQELPKCFKYLLSKVRYENDIYSNIIDWYNSLQNKNGQFTIILNPIESKQLRIEVSNTALSDSPFFKFNHIYNNDNPIPEKEMFGIKIEEKDNMIKMDLWNKSRTKHWVGWILKSKILKQEEV